MVDLIEAGLAAWRLASLLVSEDGPGAVFARLRRAAGLRSIPVSTATGWKEMQVSDNALAEALTCVWCISVWTAALLAWRPLRPLRRILAVSALAVALQEALKWLSYRHE